MVSIVQAWNCEIRPYKVEDDRNVDHRKYYMRQYMNPVRQDKILCAHRISIRKMLYLDKGVRIYANETIMIFTIAVNRFQQPWIPAWSNCILPRSVLNIEEKRGERNVLRAYIPRVIIKTTMTTQNSINWQLPCGKDINNSTGIMSSNDYEYRCQIRSWTFDDATE